MNAKLENYTTLTIRVSPQTIEMIDEIVKSSRLPTTRNAALRVLVELGLLHWKWYPASSLEEKQSP